MKYIILAIAAAALSSCTLVEQVQELPTQIQPYLKPTLSQAVDLQEDLDDFLDSDAGLSFLDWLDKQDAELIQTVETQPIEVEATK